jgi:hypothetical protein
MAKRVMRRKAADNVYLHKDFHGALSVGLEYLKRKFGAEAVREYLRQFARAYYAPLRAALKREGLSALQRHWARIYKLEGGAIRMRLTPDELILKVRACPAVRHMRRHRYPVASLFVETTRTVNAAICEGTPFTAELLRYDQRTGASVQRFFRRKRT